MLTFTEIFSMQNNPLFRVSESQTVTYIISVNVTDSLILSYLNQIHLKFTNKYCVVIPEVKFYFTFFISRFKMFTSITYKLDYNQLFI